MKTYTVQFLPDDKCVSAAKGKSLMEAAAVAGIFINNVCGGEGVCGKCRVIVKSGKVTAAPNIFLTRREIQRGVALACQTFVDGDVVVEVPPESRVSDIPQLASEDAVRFGRGTSLIGDDTEFPHSPLARKVFLAMAAPDGEDNISDQDRLYRELRKTRELPALQTGLSVLRTMPKLLRKSDWQVTALLARRGETAELVDLDPGDTSNTILGVAIDVGTTTVVAHLVDLNTSRTLGTQAKYNSQIRFGDDVIARMMYANTPAKHKELRDLVVGDINDLIAALVVETGVRLNDVHFVICAGNTTMTHLLFGLSTDHIRRDPYVPALTTSPTVRAYEVGVKISPRGLLTAVPCVASYVGGDVVADVLVTGMTSSEDVSLLVDLGTNGELVLGNNEWLVCCSASAGPAFEGGGITCGMRATTGAIEGMTLGSGGEIQDCEVVGNGKPLGICGSGLIDIVGELLRTGCIDRCGRFVSNVCDKHLRRGDADVLEFVIYPGESTALGRDITLSESDINNLIHAKGSIYMAAECLLEYMGLTFADVEKIYVAGGFGNYMKIPEAINIGLLPDVDHSRFHIVGNGSVQGAKMALLSEKALDYIYDRIAGAMTYLELSTSHKYMNEYSSCLFLPHTDIEKFPSVTATETKQGT